MTLYVAHFRVPKSAGERIDYKVVVGAFNRENAMVKLYQQFPDLEGLVFDAEMVELLVITRTQVSSGMVKR